MTHVLRFYSLVSVAFDVPLVMYYGFWKCFGYEVPVILKFWGPKVLLSILLIASVWLGYIWLTGIFMSLYFIHLIINQKEDILNTYKFVLKRVMKNRSRNV